MGKIKFGFIVLCLTAVFAVASVGESAALTLFDNSLHITGYLKNETAVRLADRKRFDPSSGELNGENKQGELSRCRSTLQLEADWELTPQLSLNAIARGYYEAKYSLDDSIPEASDAFSVPFQTANGDIDRWKGSGRGGRPMQEDFELREFKLNYQTGPFIIKVGKQQIVWGESDNLRMADVINPLDFSWSGGLAPWEDIRIPLRMINLFYIVPNSEHQYQVELALNPEDYKPMSFAPYADQWWQKIDLPYKMMPWSQPGTPLFSPFGVGKAIENAEKDGRPDQHDLRNFQGGIRVRGVFGAWDIHLYNYYQRVQAPIITSNPIGPFPVGPFMMELGPYDPFDTRTFGMEAHYPFKNTVGATFNVYDPRTATVFRGECGYTPDMPYQQLSFETIAIPFPGSDPPHPIFFFDDEYAEKDTFAYMLGFDRPTWIRWLNPRRTFLIVGQLFQSFVFDVDDDDFVLTLAGKDGFEDHSTTVSVMMNTEYYDAKILPQVVCVWETNAHCGWVNPQIAYEPTYDWRIELGGRFFWAEDFSNGLWGQFKENDEVWLMVQYKF